MSSRLARNGRCPELLATRSWLVSREQGQIKKVNDDIVEDRCGWFGINRDVHSHGDSVDCHCQRRSAPRIACSGGATDRSRHTCGGVFFVFEGFEACPWETGHTAGVRKPLECDVGVLV